MMGGTPVGVPNVTESTPHGYHVSYNNRDLSTYGCDTTAIVVEKSSAFLILNGDHRDSLRGMTMEEACAYFHANAEHKNHMSDDHQDDHLKSVDGKWQTVREPYTPKLPHE
jgi:hypothetical protein